jgi:hypothetical protein
MNLEKITKTAIDNVDHPKLVILYKMIIIYLSLFIVFYNVKDDINRFIILSTIYLLCINIFNVDPKLGLLFLVIATFCGLSELIYSRFIEFRWHYNNNKKQIQRMPYWLIPLWSIAILFIVEIVNIYKYFF